MGYLLEIAGTGLTSVLLHPLRSAVCVAAVVIVLLPYLVGIAVSRGIEAEAAAAASFGANLYVSGSEFGRPSPLPCETAARVAEIEGVTAVAPRIVGALTLGKEAVPAVLVGLPPDQFSAWAGGVEGQLPRAGAAGELVVGSALARRLGLKVGDTLPPFYHNHRGDHLTHVVGTFRPEAPLWQANLILTTFDTAAYVFDRPGLATDLLVWCRPGYEDAVGRQIVRDLARPEAPGGGSLQVRVTAREESLPLPQRGLLYREGIYNIHFVLAFVVALLVLLVTSGLGLPERAREIGILKALGWQTDEVLLRSAAESLCLSVAGACLGLLLAWFWLRFLNGYGIAGLFLTGVGPAPDVPVPFRLTPVPALLAFLLSLAIVLSGTLFSTWRAATVPPRVAMR